MTIFIDFIDIKTRCVDAIALKLRLKAADVIRKTNFLIASGAMWLLFAIFETVQTWPFKAEYRVVDNVHQGYAKNNTDCV